MLLTPPDVTQSPLAIPMWLLFELGVFFGRLLNPRPRTQRARRTKHAVAENQPTYFDRDATAGCCRYSADVDTDKSVIAASAKIEESVTYRCRVARAVAGTQQNL